MNPDPADAGRPPGGSERQPLDPLGDLNRAERRVTPAAPEDAAAPGLPGIHRWRGVYLLVLGSFLLWVVLLAVFGRIFA
jgi:hypothetical protein